jgi:hypothetical protein
VIRVEGSPRGRVRVIGSLQAPPLQVLLDFAGRDKLELDLSEIREADADAVELLAHLPPGRCELVACPKWLACRIETERRPHPLTLAIG